MNPVKMADTNLLLGAPVDWDENKNGECVALPVKAHRDEHQNPIFQSAWEPSEEEKAIIAAGGRIILTVWGQMHPPVGLHIEPK